jgi:hypothetical protein
VQIVRVCMAIDSFTWFGSQLTTASVRVKIAVTVRYE